MQVSVSNLVVNFATSDGGVLAALGPLSFDVDTGSFTAVLGPSGCGKSTLMRVLAGLQSATGGVVRINNTLVAGPDPALAIMFQDANLMPWRSVRDNIALPLELAGVSREDRYAQVNRLLPLLGLDDFSRAYPGELSGGMAQRAALGRVLIQSPDLVLLDEPFGALDAMTRERIIQDLLIIWNQTRQTILVVTHDIHEAVLMSDRVLVLSRRPGRIVADIEVGLDRPRTPDIVYSHDFGLIARRVRAAISDA